MSTLKIQQALETRLATMLPALATVAENVDYTPITGRPYQRLTNAIYPCGSYPKMALTDTALRNAKPLDKSYKLYDEKGLFVIVNRTSQT